MGNGELYQKMYLHLFNTVTDSLAALEKGWSEAAQALLIRGQQACEEIYLSWEADNETRP